MAKPLYTDCVKDAKEWNELDLWRESYKENCNCARAIEAAIRRDFDGMHLKDGCAESVIAEFGFDRVNWVLANTLRELKDDGRFSPSNKQWSRGFSVPRDEQHNGQFTVTSHPAVLDGFVSETRKAWQQLGLFDVSHCVSESDGEIDYAGKVVVIRPDVLKEEYRTPENQLFLAESGFGCSPNSRGRKVFGRFLNDGEETHYQRNELCGVLKDEHLPDWARKELQKLVILGEQEQPADDNGMNME